MKFQSNAVRSKAALVSSAAICALLSPAFAQVDTIIVTAEKRAESLQDVAVAVTAVSGEDLRARGLSEPRDLFKLAPNVSVQTNSSAGQLQLSVRGVGFSTFSPFGVQPVMVFQDEVVLNSPQVAGLFLFDAERIEVLRGPQNTLYGRNTTGGAVNFVTRKPVIGGDLNGYLDITAGNAGQLDVVGAAGGPLGDKAAFRVAVQHQHSDGLWENLNFPGDRLGERNTTMARAQLAYDVTDNLNVLLNFHGGTSTGSPRAVKFVGQTEPGTSNGVVGDPCTLGFSLDNLETQCVGRDGSPNNSDPTEAYGNVENDTDDIDALGGSIAINWDTDAFSFMSLTAYEENQYDHWESNDGFRDIGLFQFRQISAAEQWSQEFRLTSNSDNRLRWILGAFGMWEQVELQSMLFLPFISLGDIGNTMQDTELYSPYARFEYDLSDKLTLTVGGRYVYEKKDITGRAYFADAITTNPENPGLFNFVDLQPFQVGPVAADAGSDSWDMWGGKVGLEYKLDDGTLFYAHVSRGAKAGQYSDSATAILGGTLSEPVNPETVLAYEGGFKSTFADNRIQTNLAIFYNDYKNQQLQITIGGGTISRFVNAAASRTFGAEFEAQIAPADGWFGNLSVGYLNTKITDDTLPALSGGELDIEDGRGLTNAPKWTINVGGDRVIDMGEKGQLTLHADMNYTSSRNFDLLDTAATRFLNTDPSFILANAHVEYRFGADQNFRVTAWAKNIFQEIYFNKIEAFPQTPLLYMGTPRTYGVTVGVDF